MLEAVLKEVNLELDETQSPFQRDVIRGLTSTPKTLQPKYFYDRRGSELFDQICDLDEYYPYKTELALLPKVAEDLTSILKDVYALIEFGAGSLLKVKPLLKNIHGICEFLPIDISGEHLRESCKELSHEFTSLSVRPIEGDFTQVLDIPAQEGLTRLGFFPGSTIGNFQPSEAKEFLINAKSTLGEDSYLIVGVDTKKSPEKLHQAYNDAKGVTADFNRNILRRIQTELGVALDENKFEHYAYYNTQRGCIEMHLVCTESHLCHLDEKSVVSFSVGESIHTENSFKYNPEEFTSLARQSGWHTEKMWLAPDNMFSIFLLRC